MAAKLREADVAFPGQCLDFLIEYLVINGHAVALGDLQLQGVDNQAFQYLADQCAPVRQRGALVIKLGSHQVHGSIQLAGKDDVTVHDRGNAVHCIALHA